MLPFWFSLERGGEGGEGGRNQHTIMKNWIYVPGNITIKYEINLCQNKTLWLFKVTRPKKKCVFPVI